MKLKRFVIAKKNNKLTQYDVDCIEYCSMTTYSSQYQFRIAKNNHLIMKTSYCVDYDNDEWENIDTDLGLVILTSDERIVVEYREHM